LVGEVRQRHCPDQDAASVTDKRKFRRSKKASNHLSIFPANADLTVCWETRIARLSAIPSRLMLVSLSLGSCRELPHDSPCHTDDKHHDPEREESNACSSSRGADFSPSPKNSACREEQKDFSHPNDYQRIIHSFMTNAHNQAPRGRDRAPPKVACIVMFELLCQIDSTASRSCSVRVPTCFATAV